MRVHKWIILFLVLLMAVSLTSAQRGPGGDGAPPGGAGGDRPPRPDDTRPPPPNGENPRGNGDIDINLPDDFGGFDFELPTDFPTSAEDVMALLEDSDLPIDWSLDDLDIGGGSEEAYAAVLGFAQTYLRKSVDIVYAGEVALSEVSATDVATEAITQVSADLPDEVQAILAAADGTIYWSILSNGAAAVYTGYNCTGNCTVDMNNLEIHITDASMGAYLIYSDATASSSTEAYNLIIQTYPALADYGLEPAESEAGYAFSMTGYQLNETNVSAIGALTGVISAENGKSLIYAVVGVGEGYVELMR